MRKLCQRALPAVLLVAAMHANAGLFCYNYLTATSWTWDRTPHGDTFRYSGEGPKPMMQPFADSAAPIYCYANGIELAYIQKNLSVRSNNVASIQPGANDTVTWTGDDALFIWNNL